MRSSVSIEFDERSSSAICTGSYGVRPCFTMGMMKDLVTASRSVVESGKASSLIWRTSHPVVFGLGGDLAVFADAIRRSGHDILEVYGRQAVDTLHYNSRLFADHDIETIACVHGDALGGALESVLSATTIVARRGIRMGFPEIGFNFFPGMGAYHFLDRKVGPAKAREIILNPRGYVSEEMYDLGIVDILADPFDEYASALAYATERRNDERPAERERRKDLLRRSLPDLETLVEAVLVWARAGMTLTERDVRKIERIVGAQDRLNRRS